MLLTALRAYAQNNKELEDFHGRQEVRYRIDLDVDGRLVHFGSIADGPRGVQMVIPYVKRSGTGASAMPLDRGDYVLGIAAGKTEEERQMAAVRTETVHAAYIALIDAAVRATGLEPLRTMHRFVSTVDPDGLSLPEGFDATRFVAVYVDGESPVLDPAVSRWWIERQRTAPESASSPGMCGVCGATCSPVPTVLVPIRGLTRIGGQATMALVSANTDAFERHGMARATGASICLACGNSTHQILNQLIDDPNHALAVGQAVYVWWPTVPVDDHLLAAVLWGDGSEDVAATLRAISTGTLAPNVDSGRFCAVSIGANSARVVIRSWTDITLHDAVHNIERWFHRISVVSRDGSPSRRFGGTPPVERTPDLPGLPWLKGVPHGTTSPAVLAGVQA